MLDGQRYAAIDIETGKDREGILRAQRDAELIEVTPRFSAYEESLIAAWMDEPVNPPGPMARGELTELRVRQEKTLIMGARARVADLNVQLRDMDPADEAAVAVAAERDALRPIAARRYANWSSYGLDPNEAVVRLVQIGIDHPDHGHIEFVVDAFATDVRPLMEYLEQADINLFVFYKQFEMKHLAARYGVALTMIDLRDGMLALCAEWERRGMPAPKRRSLAATFERATGMALSKTEQVSNWNAEDLTPEQIAYAAADVRILAPLYIWMLEQMDALGMDHSSLAPVRTPQAIFDEVHRGMKRKGDELHHVTEWAAKAETPEQVDKLEAWSRTRRINYPNLPVVDQAIAERRAELDGHAIAGDGMSL